MDGTTPRRTILLTERRPSVCRLPPDDVDFLLANHRPHLEVLPTRRRGRYRLTSKGHVGILVTPNARLMIRPKVAVRSLFHLLDPTGPLPAFADHATVTPGTEALHFLALRLAQLLVERAAAGLHRGYAERTEHGAFLQGRLDLPAQLREPPGRKDQIHSRFEEFSVDVPCNQVPRTTAELLVRSPLIGDEVRGALRRALLDFAGVHSVPLAPEVFTTAEPDRLTEAYRPLLDLCRLLAECLSPAEEAGAVACPAFLLDMERVFERYVTAGMVRAFAGRDRYCVAVQPSHHVSRAVAGQPDLVMRPDVTLACDGRTVLVLDAKWKRLGQSPLRTDDVYQVLAYCTALDVRQAVLVYPGRRDYAWTYALTQAPMQLTVRKLRVVGSREACGHSLQRLADLV